MYRYFSETSPLLSPYRLACRCIVSYFGKGEGVVAVAVVAVVLVVVVVRATKRYTFFRRKWFLKDGAVGTNNISCFAL